MAILKRLSDFIGEERERFETSAGNTFVTAFNEVARYRQFLAFIHENFQRASEDVLEDQRALEVLFASEPARIEMAVTDHNRTLHLQLHYEIESFYIFAKILLDKCAFATKHYFKSPRGVRFRSFHSMLDDFDTLIKTHGLSVDSALVPLMRRCQDEISEYRDKLITHENNPRTLRGTQYRNDGTEMRMTTMRMPGNPDDDFIESIPVGTLLERIDEYLEHFVRFIESNRDRTGLPLKS